MKFLSAVAALIVSITLLTPTVVSAQVPPQGSATAWSVRISGG